MKALIKKELVSLLCSPVAISFVVVFLLVTGLMNWFFPGDFNIPDSGYATLSSFFGLASIVFIVLIPALSMRSFSEDIKTKNMDVFRTRPKSLCNLFFAKLLSTWLVVLLVLLSSTVYIYSLYTLSNPIGNIDLNEIVASYISLALLALVFIAIGFFASSLTKNQIIAFIVAIGLNFAVFYGFDILASIFSESGVRLSISSIGLFSHYQLMQKGVIHIKDILLVVNYIILFSAFSVYILSHKNKSSNKILLTILSLLALVNIIAAFVPNHRFDFTADSRFTISDYSTKMLKDLNKENKTIHLKIYLEGDLNSGFRRLRNATEDLLADFRHQSKGKLSYEFVNPHSPHSDPKQTYEGMNMQHMRGIVLNEVDREGENSQKIIYPYAQVFSETDTLQVNLLKNLAGYSAEENLNASIENLEFEFANTIRLFNKSTPESIAFIDGHNEISRAFVYDAEELLSKYFFVNRGEIGNDVSILDEFKVVVIAGPTQSFSETEKFVLDQYIMSGGKVLFLVDGVYLSEQELKENGQSPSMKNDTNLDDLLFTYGVRINPVLIQDTQCTSIYLTSDSENKQYTEQPWYYSALLLPSVNHPITKDISLVKSIFASSIDITDKSDRIKKEVLLTTSAQSHLVEIPEMIKLNLSNIQPNNDYFNQSFLPVAIALTGSFGSAFSNRITPDSVVMAGRKFKAQSSANSKIIVVSSSDIIRNDLVGYDQETQILPMGYDRVSERQFGNRDFIVNAVNWLANDSEWFLLRSKQQQIRLLNKQTIYSNRNLYAIINTVLPIVFAVLVIGVFCFYRKRKYSK